MTGRRFAVALATLLLLAGCREEGGRPALSAADNALLSEKADGRIARLVREGSTDPFAGIAVFPGNAFLTQAEALERMEIPALNSFGNVATLLLRPPQVLPLLRSPSVQRLYYLSSQGALARFHPAFEMTVLNRFGRGKEKEEFAFDIRFREAPTQADAETVEKAGFAVVAREGYVWTVRGPLTEIGRLFDHPGIIFYDHATAVPGVPVTREIVPTPERGGEPGTDKPGDGTIREPPLHRRNSLPGSATGD